MPLTLSGDGAVGPLSATEVSYLDGVTSAVQTQIDGKAADSTQGLYLITTQAFSAAATVNVNSCFSATYENYRLLVTYTPAASLDLNMRLRASGSDITAANYQQQTLTGADSVAWANRSINQTSISIAGGDTDENFLIMDIFRPQVAAVTQYAMNNGYKVNTTVPQIVTKNGAYNASTQADGFSLLPSTSSITGTLRVYGYKN